LLLRIKFLSGNLYYSVHVDLEGNLHLCLSPGQWRDIGQLELPQAYIIRGHFTLALESMDIHDSLVIRGVGEYLACRRGNRGITGNELCKRPP